MQKMILHPNYENYESYFLHVYAFNIWVCDILSELGVNYKQISKTDQICLKMRKKCQVYTKKLYYTLILKLMIAIFGMFINLIYAYMIFYTS